MPAFKKLIFARVRRNLSRCQFVAFSSFDANLIWTQLLRQVAFQLTWSATGVESAVTVNACFQKADLCVSEEKPSRCQFVAFPSLEASLIWTQLLRQVAFQLTWSIGVSEECRRCIHVKSTVNKCDFSLVALSRTVLYVDGRHFEVCIILYMSRRVFYTIKWETTCSIKIDFSRPSRKSSAITIIKLHMTFRN